MTKFACFHIGRGGRFNNQGHKTYRNDIKDFQELLRYYTNELFFYTEDEGGNELPAEEWAVKDESGSVLLQGREEIESEIGRLDFDGEYDTTYVCSIDELDDEESALIIKAYEDGENVDDDVLDAACNVTGAAHVHSVKVYPSNMEIFVNDGASYYGPENRDNWQGCTADELREYLEGEGMLKRDADKVVSAAETNEWVD